MAEVHDAEIIDEPSQIRQELKEKAQDIKDNYFRMAELLYEVWLNKYHIEFDFGNFNEFVEHELDMKPRKANFLVSITDTVYRLGLSWNSLHSIGWRKVGVIAPHMTEDNCNELLDQARVDSLPVLQEKVKALKQGKEEPGDPPIKVTLQLSEDEYSILSSAIEHMENEYGVKTRGKALASICYQFLRDEDIGGQSDNAVEEKNN